MAKIVEQHNIQIHVRAKEGAGASKEPPHCHAFVVGEGQIKFWLRDGAVVTARIIGKVKPRSHRRAEEMIAGNYDLILAKWNEIHGEKSDENKDES